MKRPAFMFYPADWRKDPELRVCSIAARGLWIDMIALMHEGEPYGHLVVNGMAITDAQLARLVGESVGAVRRLLAELESHNVFSRTAEGVIFSRRMVADEHIREVRAASGKLGGNPALLDKPRRGKKDKGLVKQSTEQKPTPSVAVAVALSPSGEEQPSAKAGWVAEGVAVWESIAGAVTPGELGKSLKSMVVLHGWPAVRPDLEKWLRERVAAERPCKPAWYAGEVTARLAPKPPIRNPDGTLTEYGERKSRPEKVSA